MIPQEEEPPQVTPFERILTGKHSEQMSQGLPGF